jgi:hypothetical protein
MRIQKTRTSATALACLLLFACDRTAEVGRIGVAPSPVPAAAPGPPTIVVREIAVGERIEGRYTYCFPISSRCTRPDGELHFVFTAPNNGMVVVTLAWPLGWAGAVFAMRLDGVVVPPRPGTWSPLTGDVRVIAGTRYTIVVSLAGADEQFDDQPFVLSTVMR